MLYTPLTKQAMRICFEAHKNQLDKGGVPYVFHPYHIAEQMETEEEVVVALLHDALEDSAIAPGDLLRDGIPEQMVDALMLLAHQPGTPYIDYIRAIRENPLAKKVKRADIRHNSDLARIDNPAAQDEERLEKYALALAILDDDARSTPL